MRQKLFQPAQLSIIFASVLVFASYIVVPAESRIRAYADDGLFYSIIAHNFAAGHWFSFDGGFSHTNGFHWMQMFISIASAALYNLVNPGSSYHNFLPANFVVDAFMLSLCSMAITLLFQEQLRWNWLRFVAVLLISQAFAHSFGMEAVYFSTFATVMTVGLFREDLRPLGLGILSFLLVLSRIDMAWVPVAALIATRMARTRNGLPVTKGFTGLLTPVVLGVGTGIVVLLGLNTVAAGSPIASSWLAKSPRFTLNPDNLRHHLIHFSPQYTVFIILIVLGLSGKRIMPDRKLAALQSSLSMVGLMMLSSLMALRSMGENNLGDWYDVGWISFLLISLCLLFPMLQPLANKPVKMAGLVLAVLAIAVAVPRENIRLRTRMPRDVTLRHYERMKVVGDSIRVRTDPNALLGTSDMAGRFTYFTSRRIVPLDGLANSPGYVTDFLSKARVTSYVVSNLNYVIAAQRGPLQESGELTCIEVGFPFNKNFEAESWCFPSGNVLYKDGTVPSYDGKPMTIALVRVHP